MLMVTKYAKKDKNGRQLYRAIPTKEVADQLFVEIEGKLFTLDYDMNPKHQQAEWKVMKNRIGVELIG